MLANNRTGSFMQPQAPLARTWSRFTELWKPVPLLARPVIPRAAYQ